MPSLQLLRFHAGQGWRPDPEQEQSQRMHLRNNPEHLPLRFLLWVPDRHLWVPDRQTASGTCFFRLMRMNIGQACERAAQRLAPLLGDCLKAGVLRLDPQAGIETQAVAA